MGLVKIPVAPSTRNELAGYRNYPISFLPMIPTFQANQILVFGNEPIESRLKIALAHSLARQLKALQRVLNTK